MNLPDNRFSKKAGAGSGLNNCRHTSEQIDSNFFEHAPDREIISIDMNGHSLPGYKNMLGHEGIILAQVYGISVNTKRLIRKFSSQGSIGKKISNAAFQVYPGIRSCGTRLKTDPVKFFEMTLQMKG